MERNGMNSKLIFVLLALFGLMESSCSDCDDGTVLSRYDDVGFMYSPTLLSGSVEYISTMTPEKIKVVTLDEMLDPVDSFEITAMPELNKTSVFSVNERDYKYPYVKIVPIFQVSEKFQMEFPQYVRLMMQLNGKLSRNWRLILMILQLVPITEIFVDYIRFGMGTAWMI